MRMNITTAESLKTSGGWLSASEAPFLSCHRERLPLMSEGTTANQTDMIAAFFFGGLAPSSSFSRQAEAAAFSVSPGWLNISHAVLPHAL